MGVYERIKETLKDEAYWKVEIKQTEGSLTGDLVRIRNTKTGRTYAFMLGDNDEYQAEEMARYVIMKVHSEECGRNEKTLDKIECVLGITFEEWQSEYILSEGIGYPFEGRRTGKTFAHKIKTLLNAREDITIYKDDVQFFVDEKHCPMYAGCYVRELEKLSEKLREGGVEVPKVTLKLNRNRGTREEGR